MRVQIDHLKDLLEESASWQAPSETHGAVDNQQSDSPIAADRKTQQLSHPGKEDAAAAKALESMEKMARLAAWLAAIDGIEAHLQFIITVI